MGHLHHILTITLYVMHIVGFIWPLRTNYYFSIGTMHREKRLHKSEDKGIMGVQLNVIIFKPNEHKIYVFYSQHLFVIIVQPANQQYMFNWFGY